MNFSTINITDIILGIFLVILLINGIRKGFIACLIHLLGLIAAFFLITNVGFLVKRNLIIRLKMSDNLAHIFSYLIIFILILILARIVIILLHKVITELNLNFINRSLGAVFGLASGAFIIALLLIFIDVTPMKGFIRKETSNSRIVSYVRLMTREILDLFPEVEEQKVRLKKQIESRKKSV